MLDGIKYFYVPAFNKYGAFVASHSCTEEYEWPGANSKLITHNSHTQAQFSCERTSE